MRYFFFGLISIIFCGTVLFAAVHTPALDRVLADADDDELVRVVLFLENPVTMNEVYTVARKLHGDARREFVIHALKSRFELAGMPLMETLEAQKATGNVGLLRPLWIANGVVCEITPGFLAACEEQHPGIEWVMHDRMFENTLDETRKRWQPPAHLDYVSWGLADIGVIQVWEEFGVYGQGVLVGMMDSGIDMEHPDLAGKIWVNPGEDLNGNGEVDDEERNGIDDDGNGYIDDFHGWNFDGDDNDVMDNEGHGTSTAGIVAGGVSVCDTVGIAPGATLMGLIDHQYQSSMWLGMQYAIDNGAHLISMSVSFKFTECNTYDECPDPVVWRRICEMELAAGLVHVNSTGNAGVALGAPLSIPAPACCPPPWLSPAQEIVGGVSSIIAVTGYQSNGTHYPHSGRGPSAWSDEDLCFHTAMPHCAGDNWPPEYNDYPYQDGAYMGLLKPEICAPTIVRTLARYGGCRNGFSGTSAATPHVGGTVALIVSAAPGISPEEVCRALKLTARDAGEPGEDSLFGAGKVDAYAAVAFVLDSLGEVTGTVTDDASGLPLAGVRVSTDDSRAVFTDADGAYHIFLKPGGNSVDFYLYGYEQTQRVVSVIGGEAVTEDLSLPVAEAGTLRGTVYHVTSGSASGAVVRVLDTPLPPMITGGDGLYETSVAAGEYAVAVSSPLLEADTEMVTIVTSQTTIQDFYLSDSRAILPTGPDTYGYWAFDDVDSLGKPYDWVEVNPAHGGPGTTFTISEDQFTQLTLPFTFVYYGEPCDVVNVTENGFAVPGQTAEGDWQHYPIPSTSGPGRLLAPFWTDIDADASGAAYAYYFDEPNHRFIIEWDSVQFWSWSHRRATFEVILYDPAHHETLTGDGSFQFQYKKVDFDMACTVGMENADETDGIQYLYNTVLDSNAAGIGAGRSIYFTTGDIVFSELVSGNLPGEFYLAPCWPNPFNPTTTFEWGMPKAADVRLEIFDILGRRAIVLVDGNYTAGVHRATFDGSALATGIYFARLQANGRIIQNRKMLLIK